ncbi:hypothetical protein [Sinorhizobium alkalisoli]|nr:hypothetical protein [Sinorhizobium alkalisoli]
MNTLVLLEPVGLAGAADINRYGGWRAYIASLAAWEPSARW